MLTKKCLSLCFVAIMRTLYMLQELFVPHVGTLITQLTEKLVVVSKVNIYDALLLIFCVFYIKQNGFTGTTY